jgi:hypothetical protein
MPAVNPDAAKKVVPRRGSWRLIESVAVPFMGRRIFSMAWLTLKASFRYRLIQILSAILLLAVVGLPAIIKHDGSAQGFTQILLTYTIGSVTLLLGFATLWLACGTLARDVEECQMQMVAVKPIARWQIWFGKWLGILMLNTLLLAVSGVAVYGILQWRAGRLDPVALEELRTNILIARGSIRETIDQSEIDREVRRQLQERLKESEVAAMDRGFVESQVRERVKAAFQIVHAGMARRWVLEFGRQRAATIGDKPLTIRARFVAAQPTRSGTYLGVWEIGPPEGRRYRPEAMSLAAETFHEFAVPGGLIDPEGNLTVDFQNYNDTALLFSLEDGLEVLYYQGAFAPNFVKGLGIILCWLSLLAAIGLAAASFLSFPVASFLSLTVLVVGFSTGTLKQIVEEGGIAGVHQNTGRVEDPSLLDRAAVKLFGGLLSVIRLAQDFSPVDSLSNGRSVTWGELARAVFQIVIVMSGLFAAVGIVTFTRRELATAQGA